MTTSLTCHRSNVTRDTLTRIESNFPNFYFYKLFKFTNYFVGRCQLHQHIICRSNATALNDVPYFQKYELTRTE